MKIVFSSIIALHIRHWMPETVSIYIWNIGHAHSHSHSAKFCCKQPKMNTMGWLLTGIQNEQFDWTYICLYFDLESFQGPMCIMYHVWSIRHTDKSKQIGLESRNSYAIDDKFRHNDSKRNQNWSMTDNSRQRNETKSYLHLWMNVVKPVIDLMNSDQLLWNSPTQCKSSDASDVALSSDYISKILQKNALNEFVTLPLFQSSVLKCLLNRMSLSLTEKFELKIKTNLRYSEFEFKFVWSKPLFKNQSDDLKHCKCFGSNLMSMDMRPGSLVMHIHHIHLMGMEMVPEMVPDTLSDSANIAACHMGKRTGPAFHHLCLVFGHLWRMVRPSLLWCETFGQSLILYCSFFISLMHENLLLFTYHHFENFECCFGWNLCLSFHQSRQLFRILFDFGWNWCFGWRMNSDQNCCQHRRYRQYRRRMVHQIVQK